MMTNISAGGTAENRPISTSDNLKVQALNSRIAELQRSANRWNAGYLLVTSLAVIIASAALYSQFKALDFTRKLSTAQSDLGILKDRRSDARIAELNKSAADTNLLAGSANERAEKAESHLADANARASEANARASEAEAQVALANAASKDAVAKVATAEARIAEANRAAAEANRVAEQERLARLQLEARLADRTLTPNQQRLLVAALTPSAGTIIDVAIFGDTPEITRISRLILESLQQAHWTVHAVTAMAGQAEVRGILIGTRTGSEPAAIQASSTLIRSLQAQNVTAGPWPYEQMTFPGNFFGEPGVTHDASVRMFIGSKP